MYLYTLGFADQRIDPRSRSGLATPPVVVLNRPIHDILPIEVIQLILECILDVAWDRISDLEVLCQGLDSRTREIAFATPTLWSTLSVTFEKVTRFRRSALNYAKNSPIDITLVTEHPCSDSYTKDLSRYAALKSFVKTFIVTPSKQLKILRIRCNSHAAFLRINAALQSLPLPQLQQIYFQWTGAYSGPWFNACCNIDSPSKAPSLEVLVLDKVAPRLGGRPFPQLRSLYLKLTHPEGSAMPPFPYSVYPAARIAHMLCHYSGIEALQIGGGWAVEFGARFLEEAASWSEVVTIPKLRTPKLHVDIGGVWHFLNHINAPFLEEVTIIRPYTSSARYPGPPCHVLASTAFHNVRMLCLEEGGAAGSDYHVALCTWFPNVNTLVFQANIYTWLKLWKKWSYWKALKHLKLVEPACDGTWIHKPHDPDDDEPSEFVRRSEIDPTTVAKTVTDFILTRKTFPDVGPLWSLRSWTPLPMDASLMEEPGDVGE